MGATIATTEAPKNSGESNQNNDNKIKTGTYQLNSPVFESFFQSDSIIKCIANNQYGESEVQLNDRELKKLREDNKNFVQATTSALRKFWDNLTSKIWLVVIIAISSAFIVGAMILLGYTLCRSPDVPASDEEKQSLNKENGNDDDNGDG